MRRKDCFEVTERLRADGSVETPLDEAKVRGELIPALKAGGYRAVAICLLNAYANPAHEKRLAALIAEALPGVLVTCSHQVAREFREFERASTTLLSAYVQPVIDGYLHRFESKLADAGFKGRFTVMQSNGGRLPAEAMRESAITALYSGPAAGVVGATRQAARSGFKDLITFDMGGTSTDVCLVQDGRPSLASESEIDGLPIRTPVLDIVSVGAGGGSIAWVDDGGMLRVGPQSAGADPGPACYGKGGTEPATTDAHIVIGTIRPGAFLGGRMTSRRRGRAARLRAARRHASALGIEQAAAAALQLADANIVRAIQLVSTERGRDPRDYALVPFGGAGPLHAARIAEELGISTIVVPPNAGVISAYGLVASDYTKFDAVTRKMKLDDAAAQEAGSIFGEMRRTAGRAVRRHEAAGRADLHPHARHALRRPGLRGRRRDPRRPLALARRADLAELFADAHHRIFMHGATLDRPVEIVTLRVGATLPIDVAARASTARQLAARAPERTAGSSTARPGSTAPAHHRRGADPGRRSAARRDRGLYRDHLGAARLDSRARPGRQSHPAEIAHEPHRTLDPYRLCRHQPGADRLGARDGREADPLGLLDHPARGARRLGRPDGPPRQHRGAGRADPHAARPDRRDAARLPQRHPVETLKEGDFLINNDPFEGGQHIPDVFIFTPIFVAGRVVGFGASVAHHLDLGGGAPGLNIHCLRRLPGRAALPARQATTSSATGTAARSSGWCTANVRVPDLTIGDFNAQFAANAIGVLRVIAALRALRRRQGRSGDGGDAGLLRAPRARRHRPGAQGHLLRRGCGRRRRPHRRAAGGEGQGHRSPSDTVEIDFEGTCARSSATSTAPTRARCRRRSPA